MGNYQDTDKITITTFTMYDSRSLHSPEKKTSEISSETLSYKYYAVFIFSFQCIAFALDMRVYCCWVRLTRTQAVMFSFRYLLTIFGRKYGTEERKDGDFFQLLVLYRWNGEKCNVFIGLLNVYMGLLQRKRRDQFNRL